MVWYLYLSESPVSHLDTDCRETSMISATFSNVRPLFARSVRRFSLSRISIFAPPFKAIIPDLSRRFNQAFLTLFVKIGCILPV